VASRRTTSESSVIREFVEDAARRVVAEAGRHEPPQPTTVGPTLPNVEGNAASIAEARGLVATWQNEQATIERRRRALNGSAADDQRFEDLKGFIATLSARIRLAEGAMRRPA